MNNKEYPVRRYLKLVDTGLAGEIYICEPDITPEENERNLKKIRAVARICALDICEKFEKQKEEGGIQDFREYIEYKTAEGSTNGKGRLIEVTKEEVYAGMPLPTDEPFEFS